MIEGFGQKPYLWVIIFFAWVLFGFLSVVVVVDCGCISGLMSNVCIGASSCIVASIFGMAGWGCAVFSSGL